MSIVKLLPRFLDSVDGFRQDLFAAVLRSRDNALSTGDVMRSSFEDLRISRTQVSRAIEQEAHRSQKTS